MDLFNVFPAWDKRAIMWLQFYSEWMQHGSLERLQVEKPLLALPPCQWNVPAFKVEPMRVCDMTICKPKALRTTPHQTLNSATKQLFGRLERERGMSENEFLNKLAEIKPNLVTLGECRPQRNMVYVEYDQQQEICDVYIPPSIVDLSGECVSVEKLYKKWMKHLPLILLHSLNRRQLNREDSGAVLLHQNFIESIHE